MSDVLIGQLPAVSAIEPGDVLPLDQADATRGLSIGQLDGRYGRAAALAFAWGDASPKPLLTVAAGGRVLAVRLIVDTAFDGAAPALAVGDDTDPGRLMPAEANDPGTAGTYTAHPAVLYPAETALRLTITPGAAATAGAGLITLTIA